MASIPDLEKKTRDLRKRLCNELKKEFPAGTPVLVKIRAGQKTLSRAKVLTCWEWDVGLIRVRLQTAKGKAVNVHWQDVYPE